jgi:hypothetical protein
MTTFWVSRTSYICLKKGKNSGLINISEVLGDIYLISELMETDLNRVIKSKQKLKIEHI